MIYNNNIKKSFFYNLFIKYIYPIILLYYPIKIINKQNIYQNQYKSCIYISRHTLHNYELLLGLFTLNKYSPKVIRGLGHYLIYIMCPWYLLLGIVIGTKNTAKKLIKNNERIY